MWIWVISFLLYLLLFPVLDLYSLGLFEVSFILLTTSLSSKIWCSIDEISLDISSMIYIVYAGTRVARRRGRRSSSREIGSLLLLPPVMVSEDISRFRYMNPTGHPFGLRISGIITKCIGWVCPISSLERYWGNRVRRREEERGR